MDTLDKSFKPYALHIYGLIKEHNLPFRIFETARTLERQLKLVAEGRSKTLVSKHLKGEAIDFVVYHKDEKKYSWDEKDIFWYEFLGALVKDQLGDKVTLGS